MIQPGLNSCLHHPFNLQLRLNGNSLLKNQAHPHVLGTARCSRWLPQHHGLPTLLRGVWNTAGPSREVAKAPLCGQHSRLPSISRFLATGTLKACSGTAPIWPWTLGILTSSPDWEKGMSGKIRPFADSESGQKRDAGAREVKAIYTQRTAQAESIQGRVPFQTTSQISVPCCHTHCVKPYAQFSFIKPRTFQYSI